MLDFEHNSFKHKNTQKITAHKNFNRGFAVAEVIVTIMSLALFIAAAFQTYTVLEQQRWEVLRRGVASDIAYTNLQKFAARPSIATCNTAVDLGNSTYNFFPETAATNNSLSYLTQVTQTVTGYPVDGCSGTSFVSQLLKIVSTVTYRGGSVSHATFVQ